MDSQQGSTLWSARVRREVEAARSDGLPWEVRIEWACRKPVTYPQFSNGRAENEEAALRSALYFLAEAAYRRGNPWVIGAAIRGPGEEAWCPVSRQAAAPTGQAAQPHP